MIGAAAMKTTATAPLARWDDQPILSVEHLTMRFGGLVAIDDLSFNVGRGDITALIGPNGAGKTTVFNCVTGFYKPTEGRIVMRHGPGLQSDGIEAVTNTGHKWATTADGAVFLLERMPDIEIAHKAKVARTFQNIRLFSGMTVLENLLVAQHNKLMLASGYTVTGILGLPSYKRAHAESIDKAAYWLEKVDLIDRADDPAGDLPYGAQRRLEIARAMCTDPQLLCLDEPAAGLNPRESAALNELILFIRADQGTSVLLIEHDMGVVMEISDHIVVLDYGVKISDGDAEFVRTDPRVIAAYLGVDDEEIEEKPEIASLVVEAMGEEAAEEAGIEVDASITPDAVAETADTAVPEPATKKAATKAKTAAKAVAKTAVPKKPSPKAASSKQAASAKAEPVKAAAPKAATAKTTTAKTATGKVAGPKAPPAKAAPPKTGPADTHPGARPAGIESAREGGPDKLVLIKGVGPVNEKKLNQLGIFHFDQIGAWKRQEIEWVGSYLAFPGRIEREEWVAQAKTLAKSHGRRKAGKAGGGK